MLLLDKRKIFIINIRSRAQKQTRYDNTTLNIYIYIYIYIYISHRPQIVGSLLKRKLVETLAQIPRQVDRSEKEISMLRRRRRSTRERWKKTGEWLFLVDAGSFIPSNYSSLVESACLHSLHCLRSTAKGFPNTPHPGRRLLVYSSTSLRHLPPWPKMKIGWCSREIRGGRARATRGRRSSRSREHPAMCVFARRQFCRVGGWTRRLRIIVIRHFNACHICADICSLL
jgi:hypothetical protein